MSKRPFEEIVEKHGATVFRVARAVVGSAEAEDAWSETFLAALRAYPALDDSANVGAWLVTIAHRKAIDLGRARARQHVTLSQPPDRPATDGLPGHGPDDELWAAVRALPDRQRQTVAYHYLADLPYAEVAAIVGGTAEAARRAAADGIRSLRRTYAAPSDPPTPRPPAPDPPPPLAPSSPPADHPTPDPAVSDPATAPSAHLKPNRPRATRMTDAR